MSNYPILDKLVHPKNIRLLNFKKLQSLVHECRQRIIEVTSQKGGHLASSLGTVELTVALLKKFDLTNDCIIWDVGHQAYSYKLLTGRNNKFPTIGQKDGLSKFLKRTESPFDHFGAGHASTSISASLGIAVAKEINCSKGKTIAVIGDGALTGGLAFEAMNHAGHIKKNIIVILNENDMSIDSNVGALSKTFNLIQGSLTYKRVKEEIKRREKKSIFGRIFVPTLKRINTSFMEFLSPSLWFEKLGFEYFGPIDGHNLKSLLSFLAKVEKHDKPVLLHIRTVKGKGLAYAEANSIKYHGVNPFKINTGEFIAKKNTGKAYTSLWSESFEKIFLADKNIIAISAAMVASTGLGKLYQKYPNRVFDVGIAEAHAVTFAAGAASKGLKPFVCIYSTFLQRALDNLIHDVALQNLPVRFVLDRAGFVGADGATHHGIFDLSYLRIIPNMAIMAPKDGKELVSMVTIMHQHDTGPIAIRFPRGNADVFYKATEKPQKITWARAEVLQQGEDICLLSVGTMVTVALELCQKLEADQISCLLINARFIKPLDEKTILASIAKVKRVVSLEENVIKGGFGAGVAELLQTKEIYKPYKVFGILDKFLFIGGSQDEQRKLAGIDANSIYKAIKQWLQHA